MDFPRVKARQTRAGPGEIYVARISSLLSLPRRSWASKWRLYASAAGSSARMRSTRAAANSLRCLRVMAITHLLLRRAYSGLLAYRIRPESSRSGSELSLRNLGP